MVSGDDPTNAVRAAGGRVRHVFPDGSSLAGMGSLGWEKTGSGPREGWTLFSGPHPNPRTLSERIWNRLLLSAEDPLAKGEAVGKPLVGDALLPPLAGAKAEISLGPDGAGFWDGSEYLLGKVGVAVVLVESDGRAEPSSEDWTEEEKLLVLSGVVEAMEFWASRAPSGLLSFTYEFHTDVPVSVEPIRRAQREEGVWIGEALEALGFGGANRFQGAQNLVNDLKERRGLDWAFAVFIVDSSEDEDGMFADGTFAYAYLGGPYMVLTLDNDGWGPPNFASVCAHETGHIFYALDQYYAAHVPCDRVSGYLGWETRNSQYGSCPENDPHCIMRSSPIGAATISETARGQVGWIDADGDGFPEALGRRPTVEILSLGGAGAVRVDGRAAVLPHPNRNPLGYGHSIAIDTIATVEYRIDSGPWVRALLRESGARGQPRFSIEAAVPDSGEHRLIVRAVSAAGNVTDPPCSLAVRGRGGSPAPAADRGPQPIRVLGNRPNPFNPETEVAIESDRPREVRAAVHDAAGALVRVLFSGGVSGGRTVFRWDGRDETGREAPSGRYFCRVVHSEGSSVLPMLLLR